MTVFAIDCSKVVFRFDGAQPKTDFATKQPVSDEAGRPLFVVSVLAKGPGDEKFWGERVVVPGPLPVCEGDLVSVTFPGLVMRAWDNKQKGISGVSLRADKMVVASGGTR
jgi:hypothetical protein